MIQKWTLPIRPLTGKEPRRVYVYLPEAAARDPDARFPVLYMFDGHNVFFDSDATYGKSWGMGEYLDAEKTPLIVVAVECNHHLPCGRLEEYSPYPFVFGEYGRRRGRGKQYMRWLVHVLKPRIDRRYPTLPDREHTWIAGSSMGGLMSLYAVAAHNDVFSRAAALSPSLWLTEENISSLIRNTHFAPDTVVYMDYGAREAANHAGMMRAFIHASGLLMERGVLLTSRLVPNGDHCEACWEEQIPIFMPILFYRRE